MTSVIAAQHLQHLQPEMMCTVFNMGGTAGRGTPGQNNKVFLPFSLQNASAHVNSDRAEGQNPSLGWGHSPHSTQDLGNRAQLLLPQPGASLSYC